MIKFTLSRLAANWIFLPVDGYVRDRGYQGDQPRPVGPLRYILVARLRPGGIRDVFQPPLVLTTLTNPSGYDLFFDRVRPILESIASGAGAGDEFDVLLPSPRPPRRMKLADGSYVIRVISRFYAPAEVVRTIPDPLPTPANPSPRPDPAPLILNPGPAYPFSAGSTLLRGVELGTDGGGVTDVVVSVLGQPGVAARTGRSGQWVLAFPPGQASGPVVIRFTRPGQVPVDVPVVLTAGAETALPQTAIRGWVQLSGRGAARARRSKSPVRRLR